MNTVKKLTLAALLATSALVGTAHADNQLQQWKTVGVWQIAVDKATGYGCVAQSLFGETLLRVGVDVTNHQIYLILANGAWQSLRKGQEVPMQAQIDGRTVNWTGVVFEHVGRGAIMLTSKDFGWLDVLARANNFFIYFNGSKVLGANLMGSNAAVAELVNCQQAMTGNAPKADPFQTQPQSKPAVTTDPFRGA